MGLKIGAQMHFMALLTPNDDLTAIPEQPKPK